ncbi:hypothetical protein MMC11_002066 [Xylographa trunciseda]|nr:hypothetical protein [Xylographa trunciseda]
MLPSTQSQEIIVPIPGVYTSHGTQSTVFQSNLSSTWVMNGLFVLDLDANLVSLGEGLYGFDTVVLEIDNSAGPTLQRQIVAGIAAKEFYLGVFGLGPESSNFSTFDDPQLSFLTSLEIANEIPSLSYGYTAGAAYRLDKVVGSLTLGGYDTSRFTPNEVSFPFSSDEEARLTLAIQEITASDSLNGSLSLLPAGIFSLIDSSLPYIWLPTVACDLFQQAFQLIYDNDTDLYLVDDTTHSQLKQLNPSITFHLGVQLAGGDSVNIVLPYGAFDLQASYPIYPNATNYFPIRRAANETQYTIGRAFLQEAYLIADYERSNFSVSQAVFEDNYIAQIVRIDAANFTSSPTSSSSVNHHGISGGATAGVAVGGIIVGLLSMVGIRFFLQRRQRRKNQQQYKSTDGVHEVPLFEKHELGHQDATQVKQEVEDTGLVEVEGSRIQEMECAGTTLASSELPGSNTENEMESSVVPYHRGLYELADTR